MAFDPLSVSLSSPRFIPRSEPPPAALPARLRRARRPSCARHPPPLPAHEARPAHAVLCTRHAGSARISAPLPDAAARINASRRSWRMRKKSKGCFLRWRQVLNRGASARRRRLRWEIVVAVAEVEDQQTRTRYVFVFILDTSIRMLQPRMCVIRVTMCRMSPCQYIFVNSFQHVISTLCRL